MSAKLYHTELGLPEQAIAPLLGKTATLTYSRHAKDAAFTDRFARLAQAPVVVTLDRADIFEVEVTNGEVSKLALRLRSGFKASRDDVDLILVLSPAADKWAVRTLWFNERRDAHKTLDRSKYVTV